MIMGKKVTTVFFALFFFSIAFLFVFPSFASAVPPPWRISVYPETIYVKQPHCRASFYVTVESDYKDTPIQLHFDDRSEGTFAGPGVLISSAYYDCYDGPRQYTSFPAASDYQTLVTINLTDQGFKTGVYKVRVYAFPEGTDPYQYSVYQVLTIVVEDTGGKCDQDYWPPPPSEDTPDIIIETTDGWPPPDETTDITTDGRGKWQWWRWWRLDWKWWRTWWYRDSNQWTTWWYRWWPWSTHETHHAREAFDFYLEAIPSFHSTEPGQSVSFTVNAKHLSGISQPVVLTASGLPAEIVSAFNVSSANPTFSSVLTVNSDRSLPPGTYPFTVMGNGGGKTRYANLSLIVAEGRKDTALTLTVNPSTIQAGEEVTVTGNLSPPLAVPIEILFTRPDGFEMIKGITTSPQGPFSDLFTPDQTGSWLIKARWFGDEDHFGCESMPAGLSVALAEENPSPWEFMLGILTIIIILIIITLIVYLLIRRKKVA